MSLQPLPNAPLREGDHYEKSRGVLTQMLLGSQMPAGGRGGSSSVPAGRDSAGSAQAREGLSQQTVHASVRLVLPRMQRSGAAEF